MEDDSMVRIHIRGPKGSLYRTDHLTPYFAETVVSDLRHTRPGPVEVVLRGAPATLAVLRRRLGTTDGRALRTVYLPIRTGRGGGSPDLAARPLTRSRSQLPSRRS